MKKRRDESEDKGGNWLTTFNDLVTLLLTFFVLTLSLSKLDVAKVKKISRSLNNAFGRLEAGTMVDIKVFNPFVFPVRKYGLSFERMRIQLADRIKRSSDLDATVAEEGVLVKLQEQLLFDPGTADIKGTYRKDLLVLCDILRETDNPIRVEGHTDNIPINTGRFKSNWGLSVARAANVVKYLVSEGGIEPNRLSAAGYADSRPLLPNSNDENRKANRRVEMIVQVKER